MNKLTIKLMPQDVKVLAGVLGQILTGKDIKDLKKDFDIDYLLFTCVHDFFYRLDAKNKEMMAFGFVPGKPVKMTLKRFEAIAFFYLCQESEYPDAASLPSIPDPTMFLIRQINGEIHKQFFV